MYSAGPTAGGTEASAVVRLLDPATGATVLQKQFQPPDLSYGPRACTALADGTFRLLWSSNGIASIWTLDRDLTSLGSKTVTYQPAWGANSYAKKADGTGRVLWNTSVTGGVQAALMPLTPDDEVDLSAPTKMYDGRVRAASYAVAPDGTARLAWEGVEVWFLTADDEPTAKIVRAGSMSVRNGMNFFWRGMSYALSAAGTPFIAFTHTIPTSADNQGLVCAYADEDSITMLPDVDGWGPGFCKRIPLGQASQPNLAAMLWGYSPPPR
jgi:hypothetical protein